MPELPEVETVCRSLKRFEKKIIEKVTVIDPHLRYRIDDDFRQIWQGRLIDSVRRRGKYLIWSLGSSEHYRSEDWVWHLGMSGRVLINRSASEHKHTRLRLSAAGRVIEFIDTRRFGFIQRYEASGIDKLGPEPLSAEFNTAYLLEKLKNRTAPVKELLLNQKIIAGAGNIYVNEALFRARIHPARRGGSLKKTETEKLVVEIRAVLAEAIENKGSTVSDFYYEADASGMQQNYLQVYHRDNRPCIQCGSIIRRIKQGGRSSWFCPACQL